MISAIKQIKTLVKKLPCLGILGRSAFLIVETDVLELGYGRNFKTKNFS